jgi:predicted nuclease of predicted toxin-antitoxin system
MKLLADEGVDSPIVWHLRKKGYDIIYIAEFAKGFSDEKVLGIAAEENRILLTTDKDFGELVFRLQQIHSGVILLRLAGLNSTEKALIVENALKTHQQEIMDSFTVIQNSMIRIRKRLSNL